MKEVSSVAAPKATILIELQEALKVALEQGYLNFQINLSLELNDPSMASFYIFSDDKKKKRTRNKTPGL